MTEFCCGNDVGSLPQPYDRDLRRWMVEVPTLSAIVSLLAPNVTASIPVSIHGYDRAVTRRQHDCTHQPHDPFRALVCRRNVALPEHVKLPACAVEQVTVDENIVHGVGSEIPLCEPLLGMT